MENYLDLVEPKTSFPIAKLAKEKGFNVPVHGFFTLALTTQLDPESNEPKGAFGWKEGELNFDSDNIIKNYNLPSLSNEIWYMCSCPTLTLLALWLREVHNIHVFTQCWDAEWMWQHQHVLHCSNGKSKEGFISEEKAYEDGILEALNSLPNI